MVHTPHLMHDLHILWPKQHGKKNGGSQLQSNAKRWPQKNNKQHYPRTVEAVPGPQKKSTPNLNWFPKFLVNKTQKTGASFLFFLYHDKKRNAPRTPFPQHTLLVLHILTTVEAPVFGTVYLVFKWTNRNYKLLHTLSTICWIVVSFHDSRWRGQYGLSTVFCNEHRLSCSSLIGIQHTLFLHRQHLHFSFSISQWWF